MKLEILIEMEPKIKKEFPYIGKDLFGFRYKTMQYYVQ